MGRYLSPLVRHDLSRLEDADGRQIALSSLKSCVKQLEPESISFFLDQIAEAHQDISRPYVISLYEDVARTHRTLLVPHIPRVMGALISALSASGSSLHIHEACAKVVAALASYCIDVENCKEQAAEVLRLISEPLLCVLVGKFEPVAAGAAVCLQALLESENWGHATQELVNELCFKVTVAIGGKAPTLAHIHLGCVVAKVNRSVLKGYGLDLLNAGKDIIQTATKAESWQLRVAAAQLLNVLLGVVDRDTLVSQIGSVIEVLEKYRLDRMKKVRSSVVEALKTAKAAVDTVVYSDADVNIKPTPAEKPAAGQRQFSYASMDSGRATNRIFRNASSGIRSNRFQRRDFEASKMQQECFFRRPSSSCSQRLTKPVYAHSNSKEEEEDEEDEEELVAVDFVIMEPDQNEQIVQPQRRGISLHQGRGKRAAPQCNRPGKVRNKPERCHTVSAEPGGIVIQEWVKVADGFPSEVLCGIDEGAEYDQYPIAASSAAAAAYHAKEFLDGPIYGHQFFTPLKSDDIQITEILEESQTQTKHMHLIQEPTIPIPNPAPAAPSPDPGGPGDPAAPPGPGDPGDPGGTPRTTDTTNSSPQQEKDIAGFQMEQTRAAEAVADVEAGGMATAAAVTAADDDVKEIQNDNFSLETQASESVADIRSLVDAIPESTDPPPHHTLQDQFTDSLVQVKESFSVEPSILCHLQEEDDDENLYKPAESVLHAQSADDSTFSNDGSWDSESLDHDDDDDDDDDDDGDGDGDGDDDDDDDDDYSKECEMVDAFRRSWDVVDEKDDQLKGGEKNSGVCDDVRAKLMMMNVMTRVMDPYDSAVAAVADLDEHRKWSLIVSVIRRSCSGLESFLGGSVLVVLAVPAAMAVLKCLQSILSSQDLVPT